MRVRRVTPTTRRLAVASLLATACPSADGRDVPPCEGMEPTCRDGETLRTCRDDGFIEVACEVLCAEDNPAARPDGCIRTTEGPDACKCEEEASSANPCLRDPPLPARCDRDHDGLRTLRHCDGPTWVETTCADSCSGAHDVGCFFDPVLVEDACVCASPGDACSLAGYPTCVGDELLSCDGDTWELLTCPPCDDGPNCRTDAYGVGRCACA